MRAFIDNKLVIASNNDGKIFELQEIFKVFDIHILSNRDFNITEPIEDGKTFKEGTKFTKEEDNCFLLHRKNYNHAIRELYRFFQDRLSVVDAGLPE